MCIYIVIMPLIQEGTKYKDLPITDIMLGILIISYIFGIVLRRDIRKRFISGIIDFFTNKLSILMAILFGIMLVSTVYATDKSLALTESLRYLTYLFIYFIIKYEFNTKEAITTLLKCYIFTSLLLSIFGIIQHFTIWGLDEKFIVAYSSGYTVIKIAATMYNPNAYAAYLILIIFPVIMLSIYEKRLKYRAIYTIISILLIVNLFMTYSRNAQLGFALGAIILCVVYSWKLIIPFGLTGTVLMFIPSVLDRAKDIPNALQNESRLKLWKTAIMMIKEHPILGVGNGNYATRYNEYVSKYKELKYFEYQDYPAHNSYLKVQSELGIIGIVSFLGIITIALLRIKRLYSTTIDKFHKPFYMGVMASMIAFLFMNISDNLFFVPKATTYFWFLLATVEALLNIKDNQTI
nr:O-antigen ligase family protein [Clostridium sp.]